MKRTLIALAAAMAVAVPAGARQPAAGYRGFLEWSNDLRYDKGFTDLNGKPLFGRQSNFYTGVSTSHGYQINPMFFAGAGLAVERCGKVDNWIIPLFAEGRIDLNINGFTPFGDIRLGANFAEGVGVYFSPSIGYRFNWGRKTGINLGLGLTLAGYKADHYEGTWIDNDNYLFHYAETRHHVRAYFSFRAGFDF